MFTIGLVDDQGPKAYLSQAFDIVMSICLWHNCYRQYDNDKKIHNYPFFDMAFTHTKNNEIRKS